MLGDFRGVQVIVFGAGVGLCAILAAIAPTCAAGAGDSPPAAREHPYLFFTREDIPRLKARIKNPDIAKLWRFVRRDAAKPRTHYPIVKVLPGGVAYNLTGDRKLAEPSIRYLMQFANKGGNWGRGGSALKYTNLGVARNTLPIAIGYDMLYHAMTEDQRRRCREALRTKVYPDYMKAHARHAVARRRYTDEKGHSDYWTCCYFNWNSWINGDIGLAALATLDEIPESRKVLEMARGSLKYIHAEFNQGEREDGGWDEGPMYWGTALGHATVFYAALEKVLGTDDGWFSLPGVARTGHFPIDFTGPDGNWVSFQDCNTRAWLHTPNFFYLLAARYNQPRFVWHVDTTMDKVADRSFGVLWRPLIPTPPPPPRPRVRWYRDIHWAVLNDKDIFLPFKCGDLSANHGQLDNGNFLLWLGNDRLLNDPGYGKRDTKDHNCLLVNGKGQRRGRGRRPNDGTNSKVTAPILFAGAVGEDEYIWADITVSYGGMLKRYHRHVVLAEDGYVVVLDDVECASESTLTLNWHSLHPITENSSSGARIQGKTRQLYLASMADSGVSAKVRKTRFDQSYAVESMGARKIWRVFSVLVPDKRGEPSLTAKFSGSSAQLTVATAGGSRTFSFRWTDRGYQYDGGSVRKAEPIRVGRVASRGGRRKSSPLRKSITRKPSQARSEKPAGPTPNQVAAAKEAYTKLRQTIEDGARGGKRKQVYIDFSGRTMRARLVAADETGITVEAQGLQVPLNWSALSPRRFFGIAKKYADDDKLLAAYAHGHGLNHESGAAK